MAVVLTIKKHFYRPKYLISLLTNMKVLTENAGLFYHVAKTFYSSVPYTKEMIASLLKLVAILDSSIENLCSLGV